jgi:hypothetical protein
MKILITANATSAERGDFEQAAALAVPAPRAIAIQALCMAIVLFDCVGAIMGLGDIVVVFWSHHPLLAILSMSAAILSFAALIQFGIACSLAGPS